MNSALAFAGTMDPVGHVLELESQIWRDVDETEEAWLQKVSFGVRQETHGGNADDLALRTIKVRSRPESPVPHFYHSPSLTAPAHSAAPQDGRCILPAWHGESGLAVQHQ